jgi:hypothetical protein
MSLSKTVRIASCFCFAAQLPLFAAEIVQITDVPDYEWYAGCFGTASGNLMGYWDRHGFPNFYTGPTNGGLAPLGNSWPDDGIKSMWVSRAGFDGRPADQPGHAEDYWQVLDDNNYSYESTATDPYIVAGRPEHAPDSLCDFMGSSQNKWADLDGECSGNIDAFSFNFWDKKGGRRVNFTPPAQNGVPIRDIQSGWRAWTEFRGNRADVFSQLADFNPEIPAGTGFTFEDLKAEIDAGYPVMLFLQNPGEFSRSLPGMPRANPHVHGMLAYGYYVGDDGVNRILYRTSWGGGQQILPPWGPDALEAGLSLRGVVGYHPLPQIKSITPEAGNLRVKWDGPSTTIDHNGALTPVHWYVIEKSDSLDPENFSAVSDISTNLEASIPDAGDAHSFYRVRLTNSPQ